MAELVLSNMVRLLEIFEDHRELLQNHLDGVGF